MPTIDVITYYPRALPEHAGNPLIEAFPEFTKEAIEHLMHNGVPFAPEERMAASEHRLQMLWRLAAHFMPFPRQADSAVDIWSMLIEGYRTRNPLDVATTASFNSLCESIANKTFDFDGTNEIASSSLFAALIGTPGCGKSRSVQALLGRLPRSVLKHRHPGLVQLLYVWAEAPDTDGYSSLLEDIYRQLCAAADDAGISIPPIGRGTRGHYEIAIVILVNKLNLGLLVLDEIQHVTSRSAKSTQKGMKFLTGFLNRIGVPVLVIGTWEATAVLASELRIIRRFVNRGSHFVRRMENNKLWDIFVESLFKYQWVRQPVPYSQEWRQAFYFHCQGIQDFAVKLMILLQIEAIRTKKETLSLELLDQVIKKHWPLVAPTIRLLRDGVKQEDDPTLWDVEPLDFEKYYQALLGEFDLGSGQSNSSNRSSGSNAQAASSANREAKVTAALQLLTDSPAANAQALARKLGSENPDKTAAELLHGAIGSSRQQKIRFAKTASEAAKMAPDIERLAEDDMRQIAWTARQRGEDILGAFREARLIFSGGIEEILTVSPTKSMAEAS